MSFDEPAASLNATPRKGTIGNVLATEALLERMEQLQSANENRLAMK